MDPLALVFAAALVACMEEPSRCILVEHKIGACLSIGEPAKLGPIPLPWGRERYEIVILTGCRVA